MSKPSRWRRSNGAAKLRMRAKIMHRGDDIGITWGTHEGGLQFR